MTSLSRPSFTLYDSWAECVEEFGPGHIPAAAMWLLAREPEVSQSYCAELVAAIEVVADTRQPLSEGIVHADSYWVTENQIVIGFLQLRHTLNDYLCETGGHIGYSIRPSYRRRGHATRALSLALDRARALKLERVLVTCDEDNLASVSTIEAVGGVREDARAGEHRYWISIPASAGAAPAVVLERFRLIQDPMTQLELERQQTIARLANLTNDFDQIVAASRDSNADDEHDPEGSTIAFERSQVGALTEQARRTLAEIDAAVARCVAGSYGICERCGRPISEERLRARPVARACIGCESAR